MSTDYYKYDNHEQEWDKIIHDAEGQKMGASWFRADTLDSWRHERMRSPLQPLIRENINASWLTIGDGRFGTDANHLFRMGAESVHCSDISDKLLKIGHKKGFIKDFSAQNAEALSFVDGSFDYVYCKEALHHFPRPYMAIYEMFRVARKAVVLTEPRDQKIDRAKISFAVSIMRKIFGRSNDDHGFEQVGNYIYAMSEREIEKFALGIHHNLVGFLGINDAYFPGVEYVPSKPKKLTDKFLKWKVMYRILIQDIFCAIGLKKTSLITAVIFKEKPSYAELSRLREYGWKLRELPLNPYLNRPKI